MTSKEHDLEYEKIKAEAMAATQTNANTLIIDPSVYGNSGSSSSWNIGTSTGNDERGEEVTRVVKKHSKGYYYVIKVNDDDSVFYKVFEGGWFAMSCHRGAQVTSGWRCVSERTHLPATLGATHLAIDTVVADHKEAVEHEKYVDELLETEPDNLKMIGELEKLQEGEPEADDTIANISSATVPIPSQRYTQSVTFSGGGKAVTGVSQAVMAGGGTGDVNIAGDLSIKGEPLEDVIASHLKETAKEAREAWAQELLKDMTSKPGAEEAQQE